MKNKEFYTVKHGTTDLSIQLKDFNSNFAGLPLEVGQYFYVGYYKPTKSFYIEVMTANSIPANLTFEYFDGSAWQVLEDVVDETQNLSKSGFVYFEKPKTWAAQTIEGDENFYIRISTDVNLTPETSLRGLNILLANDLDLEEIRSTIVTKLNGGLSWVNKHESARKYIIQQLRNMGHRTINLGSIDNSSLFFESNENPKYSDLTAFDLLEPFELREAAKYKAISMIYLDELSDEPDDKFFRMGQRHSKTADESLNLFMLKIDVDDDGVESPIESEGDTGVNLTWV
jgi:hypothetical protein